MSTFGRKKVSVVFLNKPNLNELGLKFLVLSLNKIQQCFEFEFPEIDEYLMEKEDYTHASIPLTDFANMTKEKKLDGDYFIGIVTGAIGENWFWGCIKNFAIITTENWKEYFAPPSVLEYAIHCIVSMLIIMTDETKTMKSHHPTRGCCLDYTKLKEEDRVDIALGYICSDCKSKIRENMGESYLECFEKINTMDWLGEVEEIGTVAHDLKKYFRADINKDTGFTKTYWEKTKEYLGGLGKELVSFGLSTLFGALLGFIIGLLLGKS